MRLTTKPGHSAQRTGILRIAWAKFAAACMVSGEVSSPSMTSISRMQEAGQKKWKPTTLSGPVGDVADLGDREARRVGGEDRVAGRGRVEVGEDLRA